MIVIIYEDNVDNFYPLINFYPQYLLRVGMKTIAEHIVSYVPQATIYYCARDIFHLKKPPQTGPRIYVSSRFLMTGRFSLSNKDTKVAVQSDIIGFIKHAPPFPNDLTQIRKAIKTIKATQRVSGFVLHHAWDVLAYNETMISHQFTPHKQKGSTRKNITLIGNKKNLFVAKTAVIHPLVTIDVSDGPVYIDKSAVIRPFSTIIGPSYIGKGTIIDQAKIVKSTIGPHCRIGGEVEACIFQGYANKHHRGFIGHSFIGEWVNVGAMTTNSDLKNNYGPIRIKIGKKTFDTGMIKLGCFIGDHTKTGIGTLIPTGAVIGSFVNFFGGGMMPQYVPCFKWLTTKKIVKHDLTKAIATAKIVMKRRNISMTQQYENIIRAHYKSAMV
jgi:UDP-N-acetylglucosamine diphosphorylase/glucosamine-1-phosphate N-acetyltransferase